MNKSNSPFSKIKPRQLLNLISHVFLTPSNVSAVDPPSLPLLSILSLFPLYLPLSLALPLPHNLMFDGSVCS